jgi:tRNA(adenine34) deaminase
MNEALKEAYKAFKKKEIPVGCVIVLNDKIIAKAHNMKEHLHDPSAHAELLAIKKATKKLKNHRLNECTLYVTLEPCAMCSGLIMQSRIKRLVYGASDFKMGAISSIIHLFDYNFQNKNIIIDKGILEKESLELIQNFFKKLREKSI